MSARRKEGGCSGEKQGPQATPPHWLQGGCVSWNHRAGTLRGSSQAEQTLNFMCQEGFPSEARRVEWREELQPFQVMCGQAWGGQICLCKGMGDPISSTAPDQPGGEGRTLYQADTSWPMQGMTVCLIRAGNELALPTRALLYHSTCIEKGSSMHLMYGQKAGPV